MCIGQIQDQIPKEAGIQVLGFICEEIEYTKTPVQMQIMLIEAISNNMIFDDSTDENMATEVIKAFDACVPFLGHIFADD